MSPFSKSQSLVAVLAEQTFFWVAVMELEITYSIGETILVAMYSHYGNPFVSLLEL